MGMGFTGQTRFMNTTTRFSTRTLYCSHDWCLSLHMTSRTGEREGGGELVSVKWVDLQSSLRVLVKVSQANPNHQEEKGLTGQIVSQKYALDWSCACANMPMAAHDSFCANSNGSVSHAECCVSPKSYNFVHSLFKNLISRVFVWLFHGRSDFMTVSIRRRGWTGVLSFWHRRDCTMWWPWKSNGCACCAARLKFNSRWRGNVPTSVVKFSALSFCTIEFFFFFPFALGTRSLSLLGFVWSLL